MIPVNGPDGSDVVFVRLTTSILRGIGNDEAHTTLSFLNVMTVNEVSRDTPEIMWCCTHSLAVAHVTLSSQSHVSHSGAVVFSLLGTR